MRLLTFLALTIVVTSSCNQHNDIDLCIEERIANFGSEVCENDASVKEYTFQGETTYAISFGSCLADYHDLILDAECDTLGLVGGFGGISDINGENYYQNAILEATIWQN